jgi:DNA-binding transcriptional ArsR family regulator
VLDVEVLTEPEAARVALDPLRSRLLAVLAGGPASASALAEAVGLPRQKVHYHLRILADHGLVDEVAQRRHGGITERVLRASAAGYVVSPLALGDAGADPDRLADRLSASYLLALAGRAIREVGMLARGAAAAGKRVPTLSVDTDICFPDAAARDRFAAELAAAVRDIAARHHD